MSSYFIHTKTDIDRKLTFHSMRLMAMGRWGLLSVMLHGGVVSVQASGDVSICSIYVICLANTLKVEKRVKCQDPFAQSLIQLKIILRKYTRV